MIIKHGVSRWNTSIHAEEDESGYHRLTEHKAKAIEETGPGWNLVDAIALHGAYAYSWHVVVVMAAEHSEEIRTYVYEVDH